MEFKRSRKLSPFIGDRTADILSWKTRAKPGTEFVYLPGRRKQYFEDDSHPFSYKAVMKDNSDHTSNDIITFRTSKSFLEGEIHFTIPIKKKDPTIACRSVDPTKWTDLDESDTNTTQSLARVVFTKDDGHQVGALMGMQRHIDALEKSNPRKKQYVSLVHPNVESKPKERRDRISNDPQQTWYDILVRPQMDEASKKEKYITVF